MTSSDGESSTDRVDADPPPEARSVEAQAAEAEARAAEAEARAEAARARAEELRRQLEGGSPAPRPPAVAHIVAVAVATTLTAGLLAATGYMLWQHHDSSEQRHRAAEYAAAARQGVINLMSIDHETAQDSVQRVLDGSTGRFRANFADTAEEFVKALKDEKITTKAVVNDAAVESMTGDSAIVLVSASSRREGPKAPKDQQEPRIWRIVLTLERDGGQIKMSAVEFV